MRHLRNFLWFAAAFLITAICMIAPYAHAAGPFGGRDWSDRYNHPDHHRAGVGSVFGSGASRTTSTVTPTSTGTSIVTQGTQRVAGTDVPIGVKSDYARGAITTAAVAAAAMCGSNPLTAIICGAAIQYGLEKGIKQCEASGWCQDSPTTEVYYTGQFVETPIIKASSSDSYCQQKFAGGGRTEIITSPNSFPTQGSCQFKLNGSTYNGGQWVKQTGTVTNPPPPTPSQPPWADPGFPPYLTGRQGSEPNFGPQIGGEATGAGHAPESTPSGGPTVTASPATGAPKTSTTTTPKSDGSTDTTTTTTTTTVTPTVTNNNTTNPKITYNTTTNTTTSTTNSSTGATTVTNTTTQTPDEKPAEEPVDPCEGNPLRAGCAVFGDAPDAEAIPNVNVPVTYSPLSFSSPAACPAPVSFSMMGRSYAISYDPLCDVMRTLRPLFLAMGAIAAAYIFAEGFKS